MWVNLFHEILNFCNLQPHEQFGKATLTSSHKYSAAVRCVIICRSLAGFVLINQENDDHATLKKYTCLFFLIVMVVF